MRKVTQTQIPVQMIHPEEGTFKASVHQGNENVGPKIIYYTPHCLMLLFFFLSPFTQDTSIKEFCFYISATFFLVTACYRKPWIVLQTPLTIAFTLFLFWAIAGIPTALNKPNTIHDIFAHWIKYVILYYLFVNYFQRTGEFLRLATLIVITGCVYSVWYICIYYFFLGHSWSERLVLYPYRDFLFTFTSMVAIGLIQHHKSLIHRLLTSVALLSILAAAILSQCRNVVLAIAVGSLIYMLKYKKPALGLILVVILSVAAFPAFRGRLEWENLVKNERISTNLITFEIIKDYPLFGIGFGMQTYGYKEFIDLRAYYQKIPERLRHSLILASPHNLLMDVTVRTGIFGVLLFLYIYWCEVKMLYIMFRRSRNTEIKRWAMALAACFAAFLVQSQFGDAAFGLQAVVLFTILSLTSILWREYQQQRPEG